MLYPQMNDRAYIATRRRLVAKELENGLLIMTAEIALEHVLEALRITSVKELLDELELVLLQIAEDEGQLLLVGASALQVLVEALRPVVIRSLQESIQQILESARELTIDGDAQNVIVLSPIGLIKGLVVPRRLVGQDLNESLLISADLLLTSLVQEINIISNLRWVDLRVLAAISAKEILDRVLEVAREVIEDFVRQILLTGKRGHLRIGRKRETINEKTLIGASALNGLEKSAFFELVRRLEAVDEEFTEPTTRLALDLLLEILVELRLKRLLNKLELLTRAIADDLDQQLLISANALHGIAQSLSIIIRVNVGVLDHWKSHY